MKIQSRYHSAESANIWFLHGFTESSECMMSAFSQDEFHSYNLFVPDLPGWGSSKLPSKLSIQQSSLQGAQLNCYNDHRMALSLAVAGMCAAGETTILDSACIEKSFPCFVDSMRSVGVNIELSDCL